jgi:hypothetical protein
MPFTVALAFLILVASFSELIVFNEEVLLALCFIGFIFFAYSYLNQTVFDIFQDRADKFEADLLSAFKGKFDGSVTFFQELLFIKGFSQKLSVFEALTDNYVNVIVLALNKQLTVDSANLISGKLNEIFMFEQKIVTKAQESCIQTVLYPLIFTLGKDYMTLLKNVKRNSSQLSKKNDEIV